MYRFRLLYCYLIIIAILICSPKFTISQNQNFIGGITVIVHGFSLLGESVGNPTEDMEMMGKDILIRAGGGSMYKNNTNTGQWELISGTYSPEKEIVLVYNWADYSNNGMADISFSGNEYLEAAADNLFASFLNLPSAIPSLTMQNVLDMPKHFIGHSRGCILLLQMIYRLSTYFPDSKVDQLTLLDPHAATTFGDMNCDVKNSPSNLPCINETAQAKKCGNTINRQGGCLSLNVNGFIKIPFNVKTADCYFRRDGKFEGVVEFRETSMGTANLIFGQFDGMPLPALGKFNREINNRILSKKSDYRGGTHTAVFDWYRGTIDINEVFNDDKDATKFWYDYASNEMKNDFMKVDKTRDKTGFYYSRIGGGGLPDAPQNTISKREMDIAQAKRFGILKDYPNGVTPHTIFNGYFDNNNSAGWDKYGGDCYSVSILNHSAKLLSGKSIKHNLMFFAEIFNFLKFQATVFSVSAIANIRVSFFDNTNNPIGAPINISQNKPVEDLYVKIPSSLKGAIGTFKIEVIGKTANLGIDLGVSISKIQLLESNPNKDANIDKNTDESIKKNTIEHVIGYQNIGNISSPKYWKNGISVTSIASYTKNAMLLCVFVSGNDVYQAGWEENSNHIKVAKYWKNGIPSEDLSTGLYDAMATSIFVSGNDVYVAGFTSGFSQIRKAVFWKNNKITNLTAGSKDAVALAIIKQSKDIYVTGFEQNINGINVAKYWKNEIETKLSDGVNDAIADCICFEGNNICIAGEVLINKIWVSKYWKNNLPAENLNLQLFAYSNSVPVNFNKEGGIATAIFYQGSYNPKNNISNKQVVLHTSVRPKLKEIKVNYEDEAFKAKQNIMLNYMNAKKIKPGDSHFLIGEIVDFSIKSPLHTLWVKKYDGSIEKLTINWIGWGECREDPSTGECIRTRDFHYESEFKESVDRIGSIICIKGNWGVGKFDMKIIYHLN